MRRAGPFLLLRITGLVVLALLAVILYADLRSVHQIYKITGTMIDSAPDAGTKEHLIAEKDKRDREERRHKEAVGFLLAINVALLAWMTAGLLHRTDPGNSFPSVR